MKKKCVMNQSSIGLQSFAWELKLAIDDIEIASDGVRLVGYGQRSRSI